MRNRFGSWVGLLVLVACTPLAHTPEPKVPRPPDPTFAVSPIEQSVNRRVDPCNDFYDYACSAWRDSHPIPPDRAAMSVYGEIEQSDRSIEQSIAEEAARSNAPAGSPEQRVGAYYSACLDTTSIEGRGLAPAVPLLDRIVAMRTPEDVADTIAALHGAGADVLFSPDAEPDAHQVERTIFSLGEDAHGLPATRDYTEQTERATSLRKAYAEYLADLLAAAGETAADAKADARRILEQEATEALATPSDVDRMNPDNRYHPTSFAALEAQSPEFPFRRYAKALGVPESDPVNVEVPSRLVAALTVLSEPSWATLRAQMKVALLRAFAPVLPHAVDVAVFAFEKTKLRGVRTPPPRADRCLSMLDSDVGDEMGKLFVGRAFPAASRARAEAMVAALLRAMHADLDTSTWLDPATRRAAVDKLARVHIMIGQPDTWLPYDGLELAPDDAFGNAMRARQASLARSVSQANKPTNRGIWGADEPTQSLDGFTSHSQMIVGLTAGFLQPPIFDVRSDPAVLFGGVGAVMGHELSHHFDSSGRRNDVHGDVHPWWSDADIQRYDERAACFVHQYGAYKADDGTAVDGARTLNENIADNGGLRLAWMAERPATNGSRDAAGFTPAQRFFLGWAAIRCENVTAEAAHRRAVGDGHAPGRYRVNGVVSNMPEFAEAFACAPGKPMAPPNRCRLW
jgi:putative endopeptidase